MFAALLKRLLAPAAAECRCNVILLHLLDYRLDFIVTESIQSTTGSR
jgi:hypothetical protein